MLSIKLPIMRSEESDAEAPSALWRVTGGGLMPMGPSAFRIGMLDSFRIQKSHEVGGELDG